jgi:hypothetical protein
MKTFKNLRFKSHPFRGQMASMYFKNGYGVSVLCGTAFHSNGVDTYEVAILRDGEITYDTDITDDVLGHLSKKEVTEVMKKVQELK